MNPSNPTGAIQPNPSNRRTGDPKLNNTAADIALEIKDDDNTLANWLKDLYDTSKYDDKMLADMMNAFSYKGFNRNLVLKQLHALSKDDNKLTIQLIVLTALRGPQAASNIKLLNQKTPREMGIPASGGRNSDKLTLSRIQASTADLAAYFLKRMNVPKRINVSCPSWLQFPSAGSIKMPDDIRIQQREFSIKFSPLIGGTFNEQIYFQMEQNAYLDPKLKLFQ